MSRAPRPLSPAAYCILESCCLKRVSAEKTAVRIAEMTGEKFSTRVISRRMHDWHAQRARITVLSDLGLASGALRGEEPAFSSIRSRVFKGLKEHERQAGQVVTALRLFLTKPTPVRLAEVLVSCLTYQIEAALLRGKEVRRA